MNLMELVVAGIMFVVLGFALTIGQSLLSSNEQSICTAAGGVNFVLGSQTWGNATNSNSLGFINPITSNYDGCCSSVNASNASHCKTWLTNSYAINSTNYGSTGVYTLAYWLPIIALAMAAGFVIAILITYLLGSVTGRHSASI
jgi:hypothetical protein